LHHQIDFVIAIAIGDKGDVCPSADQAGRKSFAALFVNLVWPFRPHS